jgi:ABC-type multidrug transport system ATPase subunit
MRLQHHWILTQKRKFRMLWSVLPPGELPSPSRKLPLSVLSHLVFLDEGLTWSLSSHRLSTITASDQILVLHDGEIVERGTHDELITLQGRYHAMWEKQTATEKKEKEKAKIDEELTELVAEQ